MTVLKLSFLVFLFVFYIQYVLQIMKFKLNEVLVGILNHQKVTLLLLIQPTKKDADVQTTSTKDADVQTSLVDDNQSVSPRAFNQSVSPRAFNPHSSKSFPQTTFDQMSRSRQVLDSTSCPHCFESRVPLACPHVMPATEIRSGAHYVQPHLHLSCDVISADSRNQQKLWRERAPVSSRHHRGDGDFLDNANSTLSSGDNGLVFDGNEVMLHERITSSVKQVDRGQGIGRHEMQRDRGKNKIGKSGESSRRTAQSSDASTRHSKHKDDLDDAVPSHGLHSATVPSHKLLSNGVPAHRVIGAEMSKPAGENLSYGRDDVSIPIALVASRDVDVVAMKDSKMIQQDVEKVAGDVQRTIQENDSFEEDFHRNKHGSRNRSDHARDQQATRKGTDERPELLGPRVAVSSPTRARNNLISRVSFILYFY